MKLILQNIDGRYYAYIETEKQFKKVEKMRASTLIQKPKEQLNDECNLDYVLRERTHMVFDLK